MNKKKITTLLITGVLTLGIVGGSFAWFTSSATKPNSFATAGNGTENVGIKINEPVWEADKAANLKPGDTVGKVVNIENKSTFNQFIRVKLTKVQTKADGTILDKPTIDFNQLDYNFSRDVIEWNSKSDSSAIASDSKVSSDLKAMGLLNSKWIYSSTDQYYYYLGNVGPNVKTSDLLKSITLSGAAKNEWKNLNFKVVVDAQGVQASHGAYLEEFKTASPAVKFVLAFLQDKE